MILFTLACSIKTHVLCQFYSSSSPCNLPVNLIKLINIQHSWSICLSQDGEYLAVLQDNMLEIRSRRDRYMLCLVKYLFQYITVFVVAASYVQMIQTFIQTTSGVCVYMLVPWCELQGNRDQSALIESLGLVVKTLPVHPISTLFDIENMNSPQIMLNHFVYQY